MKVREVVRLMAPFDKVTLYEVVDDSLSVLHRGQKGFLNDCYLDSEVELLVPLYENAFPVLGMVVK